VKSFCEKHQQKIEPTGCSQCHAEIIVERMRLATKAATILEAPTRWPEGAEL
jgi:hypothetical protein